MDDLRDGFSEMWDKFFDWLPKLLGALAALLVVYIVAKVLQGIVRRVLQSLDFDRHLHSAGGNLVQRALPAPGRFVSGVVYWLVMLFGLGIALSILGIPMLNDILDGIYRYIPKVIASVIIFLVAGGVSAAATGFIMRVMGDTPTGKIAGATVPVLVMGVASFMILEQLNIAPAIVTITYAGLIGSLFLGLALAFGLGGRDVAATILQNAYQAGQSKSTRIQQDLRVAKERSKAQAQRLKNQA